MHLGNVGFPTNFTFIWAVFHDGLAGIRKITFRGFMFFAVANPAARLKLHVEVAGFFFSHLHPCVTLNYILVILR